jgi:arginyl-tRNA--protein-N-Asp/Glu arginylyltransferase
MFIRRLFPGEGREFRVFSGSELIACSFIHLGRKAVSATYCIFNPHYGRFRSGYLHHAAGDTVSIKRGMEFYYPGYVYSVPSSLGLGPEFFTALNK